MGKEIDTADGRQKMFRIAKQMRKDRKDVVGEKYVKEEGGNILVEQQSITGRCRRPFEGLLNEDNSHKQNKVEKTKCSVENVKLREKREEFEKR